MSSEERLLESFNCPKCRGRSAVSHRISLPKSGLPKLLKAGKYIFLTCTLCGYTEVYDELAYARHHKTVKNKSSLTQEA